MTAAKLIDTPEPEALEAPQAEPKEQTALVMLKPSSVTTSAFRRTAGKAVLVFEPGIPLELNQTQCEAVADDIGRALVIAELDAKQRPVVDWEATQAVIDARGE